MYAAARDIKRLVSTFSSKAPAFVMVLHLASCSKGVGGITWVNISKWIGYGSEYDRTLSFQAFFPQTRHHDAGNVSRPMCEPALATQIV
jgi:hypothetical protein